MTLGALSPVIGGEGAAAASPPSEPRSVTAVGGPTTGNMTVKWLAPLSLNGSGLLNYSVATANDGGPFGAPVIVGKVLKRVLPCGGVTSCDYRVYATNGAGTSGPSNVATGTWTVPGKPTILTVSGGPAVGQMAMTIRPPASNGGKAISSYLYDVQVNSTGTWTGPFAVTGSAPKSVGCSSTLGTGGCSYRIYAVNDLGSSVVSAVVAGSWNLPKAPDLISVKPGPLAGGATIEWQGPGDTGGLAPTFSYEIAVDGGAFTPGASSLPSNPKQAQVECPGTNNCSYRVTATNAKGAGPASNIMTTAFNPPGRVGNLLATVTSVADLNLGSGVPTATVTWASPANTGGLAITGYDGRMCAANLGNCDETDPAWASSSVVSLGNTTTWRIPCPAGQITCTFQVRAINSLGNGPWGVAARLTPFAVTNVAAITAAPAGNVTITWNGPAEAGAGVVQMALYSCLTVSGCGNTANWTNTGIAITGNPQTVTHNCGQGVSCTYRVVAIGSGGAGSSASSATSVAAGSTLPGAPSGLTASSHPTTIGAVNLGWVAPSNAGSFPVTDYVFQRSINGGAFSAPISTGSTSLTYTDIGCGASNSCTYQVAAVTSAGTGSYSNTATAEGANVPSAPQNLVATQGVPIGSVQLTWIAPSDNGGNAVTGYFVERSLDGGLTWPLSVSTGNTLSYTDLTCGPNVSCTYRVSADNSVGRGAPSNTATALGTVVNPPTNLTAATSTANGSFVPALSNLGGVDLAWTASTTVGATYEFRVSTNGGTSFSAWSSTSGLLFAGTTSGTHICATPTSNSTTTCTYEVRAILGVYASGSSNQATAAALTDQVAPTVTVTVPANNSAATSTTPTLSGTATSAVGDSTTVNVSVKLGASVVRTFAVTRTGTAWSVGATEWAAASPTSLADGTYTVQATQDDWAGNLGTSNTRTFTVDNNAPTVAVTAPVSGQLYNSSGTSFSTGSQASWTGISGTASDGGSGVASVTVSVRRDSTGLYWNGSSFSAAAENLIVASGTTSWSLTFPVTNFPAGGSYTVRAVGTDVAGNVSAGTTKQFSIDEDAANTVYVATTGNDANSGLTPTVPKATIGAGLIAAQTNSRSWVAVAGGSYGALSISGASYGNGKFVVGGYNSTTWLRAAPGTNTVTISAVGTAVLIDGKTTNTLQQVTVSATNTGLAAGSSVYGIRLINASTGTQLDRVVVTAASGVNGTAGTAGTGNAGAAANGGGGGGACGNCGTRGSQGASGAGPGGRNGGTGGLGAPNSNTTGDAGTNGIVSGAGGGNGGAGGVSNGSCNDARGGAGGSRTTAPTAGTGGTAGAAGSINLASGGATWSGGTAGAAGTAGANGHGGGAGGGGGGDSGSFISCSADAGAGGGGGGGGGGAGTGLGTPGGAGGGSFALYVVGNSSATVTNSTLTSGNGGAGGAGGSSAPGTSGGTGGNGGNCDTGQEAGSGGGGGGGSGGGGAGGAGGGAGGPSIAIYEVGTGTVTLAGTNGLAKGTSTGGAGGAGGAGGTAGAAGSRGNTAAAENTNTNGCYSGFDGAVGTTGASGGTPGAASAASLTSYIDGTSTP